MNELIVYRAPALEIPLVRCETRGRLRQFDRAIALARSFAARPIARIVSTDGRRHQPRIGLDTASMHPSNSMLHHRGRRPGLQPHQEKAATAPGGRMSPSAARGGGMNANPPAAAPAIRPAGASCRALLSGNSLLQRLNRCAAAQFRQRPTATCSTALLRAHAERHRRAGGQVAFIGRSSGVTEALTH